ncbi:lipase family protein [Paenibacillus timonensis]|uniref:lipase family protein n=1 Tax=Paenibacillus timonensis TaxID=225915 RepID=UPI0022E114E5|nr:lipase family protein [Paenibacillus timonensis]
MELNQAQVQRALFLAAVCGQTYAQFANPDGTFVLPPPYALYDTLEAKSLIGLWERFGFIGHSADEIVIAFRGSSSASNWVADAIATQQKFKWAKDAGHTHRGFTGIYASSRRQIHSALRRLPEDKTLYITGHSLGAALATLCAMDIAANSNRVPILFTFGSPRVGDPDFVHAFAQQVPNSYRIHNEFDAVTHVPPTIFKLPKQEKTYYYRHVPASCPLYFADASLSSNHVIGSYFAELAKLDSGYAHHLSSVNPSFCPDPA